MTNTDTWGEPVAAGAAGSVTAWNDAWSEFFHFRGDPFLRLEVANRDDQQFALGSLFCVTYRVLGGTPPADQLLVDDYQRAVQRVRDKREAEHLEAVTHLLDGDFTKAGERWDKIAKDGCDLAAVRFAHDVYLHVGDDERRLRSSRNAMELWADHQTGWNFVASQHAFALEECGFYGEAVEVGQLALDVDPEDLWALHALAHVYESTQDQSAAVSLLLERQAVWAKQDSLAVHIWWHLALRLIAAGDYDEVLRVYDRLVPEATTPFRLCDLSSILWRLELIGVEVGHRWGHLADVLAERPERHTAAFLDVHTALVYSRQPNHPGAKYFFDGIRDCHIEGRSENDEIFTSIVKPLVKAIEASAHRPRESAALFDSVENQIYRIGGSIVQRQLLSQTRNALEAS